MMNRQHNVLEKCTNLKPAILLYQRSLKCRNFRELDKDTIALLSYQVNKVFLLYQRLAQDEKLREALVLYISFGAENYIDVIKNCQ